MDKELFDRICEESRKAIQESNERWKKEIAFRKAAKKKVYVYNEFGAYLGEYLSLQEAADTYDLSIQQVIASITYKKFYHGIIFSRK